ncbi:glycerol-3-phosphate dehydrogenase/oxidase [Phycisphaera mikurensis]|uniref:Glycerol-3-phosphate dehydrogenase n=1 Tax=Phycisphaera mikurensis (strain NBRC 102666 / KCTC 22515 / FYK2301M01) TaxID=1142394 RepID=I0IGV6_PHYMF|nr:glycerol-3-phosphate dehydrogenase/oxidase [Phycisphaera mikurensis]MBB6440751.1 glycerol-3-phosphate dehydrogenase [Phycisphaera mikurensis]BAM04494.1 glycerol-3-phosphate dehydrogenase [Phycisphaera mikurensis NBRC 102666]
MADAATTPRRRAWDALAAGSPFDVLVIGGGCSGLGVAVDAADRGLRVALVERDDFAAGSSSRSTKLVHGGVRYLQRGDVKLVREALHERGLLLRNAPHLCHRRRFVIPAWAWWERPWYGLGMKAYDALAGRLGLGPSRWLSREQALAALPNAKRDRLRGAITYEDGQFDDARLCVALARTAQERGAVLLNHAEVAALVHERGRVAGAEVQSGPLGHAVVRAEVVVNCTGPFSDGVLAMDRLGGGVPAGGLIAPSRGSHVVLDAAFLGGPDALMVPRTPDGRVLFAIPWHGRVVVGTTDEPLDHAPRDPRPSEQEVAFLLQTAAGVMEKAPGRADVRASFAGVRPLVRPAGAGTNTAKLSRDHTLRVSASGLITLAGGKWTTYRRMAEDAVDRVVELGGFHAPPCGTRRLPLHGAPAAREVAEPAGAFEPRDLFGSLAPALDELCRERPGWNQPLHPSLPHRVGEVAWAARHEMAETLEDALARRLRVTLLDVEAARASAAPAAAAMAAELGWDDAQQAAAEARFLATLPPAGAGPPAAVG